MVEMEFFAIIAFMAATSALASPLKREKYAPDLPFQTITYTAYTTVTGDLTQSTAFTVAFDAWWPWWNNGHRHGGPWPKVASSQSTLTASTCTSMETTSSSAQDVSTTTVKITSSSSSTSPTLSTSSSSASENLSSTESSSSSSSSSSTFSSTEGTFSSTSIRSSMSTSPTTESSSSSFSASSSTSSSISSTSEPSASSSSPSSTSTSASSSSSSSTSTSGTAATPTVTQVLSDYAMNILEQHNNHRGNHSVSEMTWSDNMASIADEIAHSCVYAHNTSASGGGYGQNIGAGSMPDEVPALITNLMYNGEIELYPGYGVEPDMSNFEAWGHYSQIVWKGSQQVGCATVQCDELVNVSDGVPPYFTVCNYYPTGNVNGAYAANVLEPGGLPTVTVPA